MWWTRRPCAVIFLAIVDRSLLVVAGLQRRRDAPVLARWLIRAKLENLDSPTYGQLADLPAASATGSRNCYPDLQQRRVFWETRSRARSPSVSRSGRPAEAERLLEDPAGGPRNTATGEVYWSGPGPGIRTC